MTDQNLPFQSNLGLNEEKREASISGVKLQISIDNLSEDAQKLFEQSSLQFGKDLFKSLNHLFKDNGLDIRFSDYTEDLQINYPARKNQP